MSPTYPVHVDADLDAGLSRWLWLVKWLLAIPHYIVLAFLWLAFFVLSIVAFVAILITGRYPRAIFDFNVGVLRWTWRVSYYTYGALATDRYPPFTLSEVPDYPAHFSVDYPEHLSRGLVLVKWWLLAIPHYLVVALIAGGGLYITWGIGADDNAPITWGGGLIGLLAFFAAIALLFTGRYPEQIFDIVLGLNRWVLRVAAYAGLMTDEYPPFRLDLGGHEPTSARVAVPAEAPPAATGRAPVTWSTGRVITVVIGSLVFLLSGALLAGGTALAIAGATLRDDQGFLMTPSQTLRTNSYAIASEPLSIDTGGAGDSVPEALLGKMSVRAEAAGASQVFVGIAPAAEARQYLAGVEHATLIDLDEVNGVTNPVYRLSPGGAPSASPAEAAIWVAAASGTGTQQLAWEPDPGRWTVVVMNPDGSAGVASTVAAGAELPVLGWVVVALFVAGGLLLLLAIGLVLAALHGRPTTQPASGPPSETASGVPAGPTGGPPPGPPSGSPPGPTGGPPPGPPSS